MLPKNHVLKAKKTVKSNVVGGGADSALHVANRVKVFMKELKTTIPTSGRKFIPFSGAGDKAYIKPFCH